MTEQDEYDMSRVELERREYAAGFKAGVEAAAKAAHMSAMAGVPKGRKPSEHNQARAYLAEAAIGALLPEPPK